MKNSFIHIYQEGFVPPDRKLVMHATELVEKHFRQHRELAFYLERLGVGEWRLNRLLGVYLGMTLYELIQDRIHQEAVCLLTTTTMSVKEITYALGLLDPCYFSRCFTRIAGISPTRYRTCILRSGSANR